MDLIRLNEILNDHPSLIASEGEELVNMEEEIDKLKIELDTAKARKSLDIEASQPTAKATSIKNMVIMDDEIEKLRLGIVGKEASRKKKQLVFDKYHNEWTSAKRLVEIYKTEIFSNR